MPSAVDRVFAIPELLEHILLYLDNDAQALSIAHSKTLFSLQRVNRSFKGTIRGSKRLEWRMGTARPLSDDAELVSANQMVTPYLQQRELKVGPFNYRGIGSSRIELSIYADGVDQRPDSGNAGIGILGKGRRLYSSHEQSWRTIQLIRALGVTIVEVNVKLRDPCKSSKSSNDGHATYSEWLIETEDPITLGRLADMLTSVVRRTLLEHKVLAYCNAVSAEDPAWNHNVAEKFLKGASMYLAWMRFEPERALAKLQKLMSEDSMRWVAFTGIEFLEMRLWLKPNPNLYDALYEAMMEQGRSLVR